MTNNLFFRTIGCLIVCLSLTACEKKFDPAAGSAPPADVTETSNMGLVTVEKPDQFSLVRANRVEAPARLNVTGSVNPDIAREVPVISLASGRVVDIKARLDDYVKKGQLLLKVQSPDITNAFDVYLKAVNDEQLTNKAYVRAKDLYEHGALSLSMLEQAEDSERDNKADLDRCRGAACGPLVSTNDHHEHRAGVCAHLRRHCCPERHHRSCCRCELFGNFDGLHHR